MTADRLPLGFPLIPAGAVIVSADVAPGLVALLGPGQRQLRADGVYMLPEPLQSTVTAIEVLAKLHRGESPLSTTPAVVWIRTKTAAEIVGVSTEAVRKAALTGRIRSRRVGRLIEVSEASVGVWAEDRAA